MATKTKELARDASTQNNSGTAIIFVHGLGGAPEGTWRKMFDCFSGDADFADVALDCFHFPTGLLKLPLAPPVPGLLGIADGLRTFIEERHGDRGEIFVVAHSLGGVIARQFIVSEMQAGRDHRIKKLALIAVPSNGSALAGVGSAVSFRHRQLRRLSRDDEGLRSLNIHWDQLGIEDKIDVRYIVGGCDRAVPHDSAVPLHGRDNKSMLINEDHRSIIKPNDEKDIRYRTIRRFLLQPCGAPASGPTPVMEMNAPVATLTAQLKQASKTSAPVQVLAGPRASRAPDPLFEAYTLKDDPFYIVRAFDNALSQSFSASHIWVTGESGIGKTSALRRAAYQNGWHLNQITLAAYEVSSPTQLFRAMCIELASLAEITELPSLDTPANELFLLLKRVLRAFPLDMTIANIVEEMPVEPAQLVKFADLVAKFLSSLVGETDLYRRVQFAFSSLAELADGATRPSAKSQEYIQLMAVDRWSLRDIERLTALLASSIEPQLSADDIATLIGAADGSPRFVKQSFRHLRNGGTVGANFDAILDRVRQEQLR